MLKRNKKYLLLGLAALTLGFSSCKKDKSDSPGNGSEDYNYSLFVTSGTPAANYILQVGSLTEGTATTAGKGVETDLGVFTLKDGYYYGIENGSGNLVKFQSDNKMNTTVKKIPLDISWAGYSSFFKWKDDKTLVLFSSKASLQFEYAIINVENMTVTASGDLAIPAPVENHYYWGNNVAFVGNKLYISYTQNENDTDAPIGKAYLATIDYPEMNNITVTSDSRFTYPSPYNLNSPGTFVYNDVAYFLTSPSVWATTETSSFVIYRVNKGANEIDPSYMYELTDQTKEEAIGMFSIGNGKAIVKILDKSSLEGWQDYSSKFVADYYVVDVINKTKERIDIPKSIGGGYSENVLFDNGKAYIATQTEEGFYVYEYDPSTSIVKKGLKLEGISDLSRLQKLN